MNLNKIVFVIIALLVSLLASIPGTLMTAELISIGLFVFFLLDFIDSIGKSYSILDISILLALFQCLLMPIIVYHIFNSDALVIALKYDMVVTAEVYYSFMLPAVIAFILGVKLTALFQGSSYLKYTKAIAESKKYLTGKGNIGILLMIIGFVSGIMQIFIPGELKYVAYLFSKLLYVGALYTYFSDVKNRTLYLVSAGVAILAQSLAQGMFGELIYTLILAVMLLLLGKKIKTSYKFGIATFGFVFIMLLQSVKTDYRTIAWKGDGSENNAGTFFSLILDRISNPERFFDWTLMFPTVVRFNQGMIVGKVLDHVPNRAPFAEGETIFTALAASFVPRLLWPDKPMSGGHANMERFTGFIIQGYSMNVSPMGEAYGNYGVNGGIVFMFFYGLFFSVVLIVLLNQIKKTPTLVLWFPILFLNSIQMETDILMCVNSLIKNLIFIGFCYWAADRMLRLKL
ncbi:MAG: hypothetical protein ABL872_01255 [Lacibacter sp.]